MDSKSSSKIGTALIILAGCFWGSMGIFVRKLGTYGFSAIQIVSIRITLAALIFSLVLLVKDRRGFKISPKDIPLFLGLESVEASKAGIIATIEPMVATLIGILVFEEKLTIMSGAGILLILAAVVILNLKRRE